MNSPVEQFTIKTIYELKFMDIDVSFTNASLFMMLSIFGSVLFLLFIERVKIKEKVICCNDWKNCENKIEIVKDYYFSKT